MQRTQAKSLRTDDLVRSACSRSSRVHTVLKHLSTILETSQSYMWSACANRWIDRVTSTCHVVRLYGVFLVLVFHFPVPSSSAILGALCCWTRGANEVLTFAVVASERTQGSNKAMVVVSSFTDDGGLRCPLLTTEYDWRHLIPCATA
uniref:Uncharacterized protein n=1 Tax=Noctiluca scintillans TaxID=2966 RepID=A0A7S1EYA7_NOCSC